MGPTTILWMPEEPVVRVERTPPIATVTLSRPQALNAITREMLMQLDGALGALAVDDEIRVVVLTGEGSDEILGGYLHFRRDLAMRNGDVKQPPGQ